MIKFALAQMNSSSKWEENLAQAIQWIGEASKKKAEAILFPENFLYMGAEKALPNLARELHEEGCLTEFQKLARDFKISILLGSYPERSLTKDKIFNTSLFVDSRGRVLGRYRKMHLFDVKTPEGQTIQESRFALRGSKIKSFRWKNTEFGMSICYDLRFPRQYRKLCEEGAEVLLVPAAFTKETGKAHWHTLLRARAIENLAFVLAPAQTGNHPGKGKTFGHSLVVDPWGKVLYELGEKVELKIVQIDPKMGRALRKKFPVLQTDRAVYRV